MSPKTIKATEEYLRLFLHRHDPLTASKRDLETYLGEMAARGNPSTMWTSWRHLRGFDGWLTAEGDIEVNPMDTVRKLVVPPTEVRVLSPAEVRRLLAGCAGRDREDRRDLALLTLMLDTGLRLSEVAGLTRDDISVDDTIRVFGKGRKRRTVALGHTSATALRRWIRLLPHDAVTLWPGLKGPMAPADICSTIKRRGRQTGISVHPHQLQHTFVDTWLRIGGAEVDLARLCRWSTTRMAERYAQHRADERAVAANRSVAPLDSL